jgi:double-GTPase-like protein
MNIPGGAMNYVDAVEPQEADGVLCPMCLSRLERDALALWRWDSASREYVELQIPAAATVEQRRHSEHGTMVKCPDLLQSLGEHYLPVEYVRHGRPVVIGFVGATNSGKTHLLSAIVGAIEAGELSGFGITSRPLDEAWHHRFMEEKVRPLLEQGKVLPPTEEKIITFADALLMGTNNGLQRPVALFDVAGGELSRKAASEQGAKKFLEIADGLIFVADSARLDSNLISDDTFSTLLGMLGASDRLPQVSAAVVVNKADLRRFDDPVTRWLRTGLAGIDPDMIRRESADVFAYLESFRSQAWVKPYRECGKGTLHVASATGGSAPQTGAGGVYPRGVTPRRVLGPFMALLAMTGVVTDERAQKVGA